MGILQEDISEKANRTYGITDQPVIEPITVDELKTFARIDGSDEDTLLEGFIEAVRIGAENYLSRALISQSIRMIMDWWPGSVVELFRPPLISIIQIVTIDEDDIETVYDSNNYYKQVEAIPGLIILKQGITEPQNTARDHGGFAIDYKAGYGLLATDVPASIREGLKLWATALYENRAINTEPPPEALPLLSFHRVGKL